MNRWTLFFYLSASAIFACLYGFPTNGLSHFDEGQYAFARVWPWVDKFDVDQAFFSPPLYPFLVGLVQHLPITRPDLAGVYISWAACWASLFFGVKLAVAWWGRAAGFPAFVLLLFSPMRMAFGTIGLTDALFSALLLATLCCATNAFRRNSSRWTLAAALLAGSTWSCKYNGFIALGIIAGFILQRRTTSSVVRWLVICLIAGAIMAPWYWAIHTHHPEGLDALRKHQQGYLRGVGAIAANLRLTLEMRSLLPGPHLLLLCWAFLIVAYFVRRRWTSLLALAVVLAFEEVCYGRVLAWVGLLSLPVALWSARWWVRAPIVAAVALTVFLPGIYTPYLRLWLPGEHVLLIVLAGALAGLERRLATVVPRLPAVGLTAVVVFVPSAIRVIPMAVELGVPMPNAIREMRYYVVTRPMSLPCYGYREAAAKINTYAKDLDPKRVATYVRPALLYYLAASDLRVPILRMPDEPFGASQLVPGTTIVTDVAVLDSQRIRDTVAETCLRSQVTKLGEFDVWPHIITLLDDYAAHGRLSGQDYTALSRQDYKVKAFHFAR